MPLLTELWKIRLRELQRFRAYGAGAWFPCSFFFRVIVQSQVKGVLTARRIPFVACLIPATPYDRKP